ncbi:MAG: PaaI family thioesterase [Promethearchaeota archaeon]
MELDKKIQRRSKRMIRLLKAYIGQPIGKAPGPIPAFSKWLNGMVVSVKRGEIEVQHDLRPEMANPTGLLHGGMQAALIDDTIGMCTATLGYEGFLITIDVSINFLGKVKVDESVIVKASIVREGRNIVNFFAQISDLEGNLIATGNANLLKTQYKPDYIKALDDQDESSLLP